jgi:crotonobetainyl-CoA:carnitine CoA-transferase CaiB-like acyl-CoA transferase
LSKSIESGPLEGLRVVEIGASVAVRYCGRLFATLGAEVRQQAAAEGDRGIGYAGAAGEAYGRWLDQGKLTSLGDGGADLVIGGPDAASIALAEGLALGAGAPLLAIDWFDQAGPYGDWRATDEIISALNGVSYSFGERFGPPMLAQGHAPQITAGVVGFNAALGALLDRPDRRPRRIDVNVHEAAMCYAETGALTSARTGAPSVRLGVNRFVPTYPCAPYRALDGWVGITCLTPSQWRALCGLIERPALAADPRFATAYQRLMIADEVDKALAPAIARRTQAQWVELGLAHRIPIAPMVRPGQLPEVEHWRRRDAFGPAGTPDVAAPRLPYRLQFERVAGEAWAPGEGEGPLCGLRVVDFSMGWAGPLCARTLGDLGADVVKIESEGHPDWWRGWDAGSVDVETRESQLNFINVNRNKRGVDIDLTLSEGKAAAGALIAGADIVVENYAAGVLAKLGLGQEVQRRLRPGLISLSMPAFGVSGPLSGLRAYGSTVEQASGLPFINGEPHWPPAQQHVALGDPIAGLYAVSAVLACLYARGRLGGADIDLAQVACLFQLGADAIIAEQLAAAPVARTGAARPRLALCEVVPAKGEDDWIAVAVAQPEGLGALARVVGEAGGGALARWAGMRTAAEACAELQAVGVPAAPIQPPHALTRDPQLQAVGYFANMERGYVGEHQVGASPFRFDGARPALRRSAPLLGEHTEEVMAELAFSSELDRFPPETFERIRVSGVDAAEAL